AAGVDHDSVVALPWKSARTSVQVLLVFFSSRRRHTRLVSDWSSDVCSSDLAARMDDPALDVTPQDVLVLQNAGPHAPECMPEAGYLPIPKKLAQRGVKDMIRVSDARMSGTAFGTIVLHRPPDSAPAGPSPLV